MWRRNSKCDSPGSLAEARDWRIRPLNGDRLLGVADFLRLRSVSRPRPRSTRSSFFVVLLTRQEARPLAAAPIPTRGATDRKARPLRDWDFNGRLGSFRQNHHTYTRLMLIIYKHITNVYIALSDRLRLCPPAGWRASKSRIADLRLESARAHTA
jgi:hypothetical protein